MDEPTLELRLVGDQQVLGEIRAALEEQPESDATVLSHGLVANPTALKLDLGTVADVVGLVSAGFFDGPMVRVLLDIFKRNEPKKIFISCPLGDVTFTPRPDLTEDELRAILRKLVAVL